MFYTGHAADFVDPNVNGLCHNDGPPCESTKRKNKKPGICK